MKGTFPIWENVAGWSNLFHFFHLIGAKQDTFPITRLILEQILEIFWFFKLCLYPITIRMFSNGIFTIFFSEIVYQLTTLEFIGINFLAIFLFVFALLLTFFLLYYYHHRERVIIHHLATPLNFILQEITPIFLNYSSSAIYILFSHQLKGIESKIPLIISILDFVMYSIYTFIGALFHKSYTKRDSVCHSFWNHQNFMVINIVVNLVQQSWVLIDYNPSGLYWVMAISFVTSNILLLWLVTLPYFTYSSNVLACEIFGISSFYLILQFVHFAYKISAFITICTLIISFPLFRLFISHGLTLAYFKIYDKFYRIGKINFYDADNRIYLPNISAKRLITLFHYLLIIQHEDLHELLIAAIDSDRDDELTIECAKMLMISSSIPHRIREKLFEIDHKKLSLSSRHFLMELQYEMNRYKINKNDIENVTKTLQDEKQKVKIYLYAFSNSLIDKKYEYEAAFNYSMACHDLRLMYDYAFEWNPLSFEILDSYRDFLEKISGDVILSDLLNKKAKLLNSSLIQTNDQKPKINTKSDTLQQINKTSDNNDVGFTERLKIQKLLDKVSHVTFKITSLFVLILLIKFLFPYYNYSNFISTRFISPSEYFNYTHSPSFFKISFLSWFISKYFEQIGQKSTPVKIVNSFGSLNSMLIYLGNLNCYPDNKPILNFSLSKTIELKTYFYQIFSENSLSLSSNNLARTEYSLHIIFDNMESLIERYETCAKEFKPLSIFSQIRSEFFVSLFLLIFFSILVLVVNKKEIMKAIEIFSGIELSTLEEFRSKLFIQFNQNSFGYPSQEIDNDGALDLEEIEDNDTNNLNQNFDLSDLSGKPKNFLMKFDMGNASSFVCMVWILFFVRYVVVVISLHFFAKTAQEKMRTGIMTNREIDEISVVYKMISILLCNISGIGDMESNPTKLFYNDSYSDLFYHFISRYNTFLDSMNNMSKNEKINEILLLLNESDYLMNNTYQTLFRKNAYTMGTYCTYIYLFCISFLVLLFLISYHRYYTVITNAINTIKHLVLILHSKYSPTESMLVNTFIELNDKENDKIDLDQMSDIIVGQIRDPVIFFDSDFKVTRINQQGTAQLGYSLLMNENINLQNIIPEENNHDFYDFIRMMFNPLGIIARHQFTVDCVSKDLKKIRFNISLIPGKRKDTIKFGLLMRNQTDVINLQEELEQTSKKLFVLLKRLVPMNIAKMMIDNKMPNMIVKNNCVIMSAILKRQCNIGTKTSRLDVTDITEITMSIMDSINQKYKNILRIRSFNGCFMFIGNFFNDEDPNESINNMIDFANHCAYAVNKTIEFDSILSCLVHFGGPVYSSLSGISKTIFDFSSKLIVETFDDIDIVPPGKLVLFKDCYDIISNKKFFSRFKPQIDRKIEGQFYIMNSYLGMNLDC